MKNRFFLSLLALSSFSFAAQAQINIPGLGNLKLPTKKTTTTTSSSSTGIGGLTNTEAANGLKEALIQGISKGSDQA